MALKLGSLGRAVLVAAICAGLGTFSGRIGATELEQRFLRGDANVDGRVTLADVFAILRYAYQGASLKCLKAADVDDDGKIQFFDAYTLLGGVFLGHGPPPPPFAKVGADPTEDSLTCWQGLGPGDVGALGLGKDAGPGDPPDDASTDCDDEGGGPDLEFIHFIGGQLVAPGDSQVRAPIYFTSAGGIEGATLSLHTDPRYIRLEQIEFLPGIVGDLNGSDSWSTLDRRQLDQGYLSATFLLGLRDPRTLPRLNNALLAYAVFSVSKDAPIGTTTKIVFEDTPAQGGLPPIRNEVSRKSAVQPRHLCGLSVAVVSGESLFIRGDANRDRTINLADVIAVLHHLFAGSSSAHLPCPDAADLDDDGKIQLTDAIGLVSYLFLRGAAPHAPFPSAGYDPPEGSSLGCAEAAR